MQPVVWLLMEQGLQAHDAVLLINGMVVLGGHCSAILGRGMLSKQVIQARWFKNNIQMKLLVSVFVFRLVCALVLCQSTRRAVSCSRMVGTVTRVVWPEQGFQGSQRDSLCPALAKINQECERSLGRGLALWFGPQVWMHWRLRCLCEACSTVQPLLTDPREFRIRSPYYGVLNKEITPNLTTKPAFCSCR